MFNITVNLYLSNVINLISRLEEKPIIHKADPEIMVYISDNFTYM